MSLWRRGLAEAAGTFFLVLAGCGAILAEVQSGALGHTGVALTFGLVVAAMIFATGHVSGAHLNPAVTLAFFSLGRIQLRESLVYWLSQLAGAVLASGFLSILFPQGSTPAGGSLGATLPSGGASQSLLLETLLTAMLMFVIVGVATDRRAEGRLAALAIGGAVAVGALWGGPISGASMNPARSFGPALVAGAWSGHWVYWLGPGVGALLGAWLYEPLRER